MRHFISDISYLWRQEPVFRLASIYLLLFLLLVLLLPWLPLPYSPKELHLTRIYLPPFHQGNHGANEPVHWLGTDALGRDVLSFTLHGARTAAFISIPVMLLTSSIGLLLGTCAGFFGNNSLKTSLAGIMAMVTGAGLLLFYGIYLPMQFLQLNSNRSHIFISLLVLFLALLLVRYLLFPLLRLVPALQVTTAIPLDRMVLWLIETFTSIPRLVLILVLASFAPPNVMLLSALLIITYWTGIARLARAEILRIKQLPYFEAATGLGVSKLRVLLYHVFPNLLSPILVSFTFGLAGLMAFESTLSFLGVGVPADIVSWGKMIAGIRHNTSAWWLAAFPGSFLVATVLSLQICSYKYLEFLRKHRS